MKNGLSIAILGTRGIPNLYGGFEQCAEYLGKGLAARGYDVTVYNPHWHPYDESSYAGVRIVKRWCPERKLGAFSHFIYDYICLRDALKRDTDVILELGYGSAAISYLLCRVNRSIIVTNMDGLEWKRDKWSSTTRSLMRWFEKIAVFKSHELVSDNPGIKDYLYAKYGKNSVYIPYGAKIFQEPDANVLARYGVQKEGYYLCVARIEPENNIGMILDGYVESGSRAPFLVVGGTQSKYGSRLVDQYKDHRVVFLGGIYDFSLLSSLRHYAKLYFHGHSVGGTNPSLLEAMGSGSRIRAHDNAFNRSVTMDGALYFKDASDVANLISSSDSEIENDSIRIQENYARITQFFDWDAVVEKYSDLIQKSFANSSCLLAQRV